MNKIPLAIECRECGRICEAPLMEDAELCCRAEVAEALVEWAEKKILADPEIPDYVKHIAGPLVRKMAEGYISEILGLDPPYILGKNKNDG